MSRPTQLVIEPSALLHNLQQIRRHVGDKEIIAMVKANAYGCGVRTVVPTLDGQVDAFGVACLEEALTIRALGAQTPCILFQGVFSGDELLTVAQNQFGLVLHHAKQLQWLLSTPLPNRILVWVKVNTGMNRLGFTTNDLPAIMNALQDCPWVDKNIGLMTHMACSDEPERPENQQQIAAFESIQIAGFKRRSIANSAAIIALPQTHADAVRPGIMLYGVSPFADKTAADLELIPVMRFISAISAIHHIPAFSQVGYGATWTCDKPSVIGIVAAGYGDGYPRHIAANTPVWVAGQEVPIVGRVSMDMLAVDLTNHPCVEIGNPVELWGAQILVERIAKSAGTIGYELLCQLSERVRHDHSYDTHNCG